jgi:integrase
MKGGQEMKKVKKRNQPEKGSRITVDPIQRIEDIRAISKLLEGSPRDRLLFVMGVNNGIRTGDLLKLKVKDVRNLKSGDYITIKEGKTKKDNVLVVNKTVYKALKNYFDKVQPDGDGYLFESRKGKKPLQTKAINKMIKNWTKTINLESNYGAHTLRKTWGYIQRTKHGVGFEIICKRFNHSSPSVTMRYLGIQDKEVHEILMNEIY